MRKLTNKNRFSLLYPDIAKEWHPTKNGDLRPENFMRASHKKVWWKCSKGDDHEWETTIYHRARNKGTGCPFCKGLKVGKDNNFLFLFPDITKEWHPTKNGDLRPENFMPASNKKAWWKCSKEDEHEWKARISDRTRKNKGTGCPFCKGLKVGKDNNFLFLFPDIAKEWHPTKNGDLRPENFVRASHKKVWWKCSKGHEWEAPLSSRSKGHGCQKCTNQTSEPEIRIFTELMYLFDEVLSRNKINGKEIDIFIPEINIGIEYDGYYWHKDKEKSDIKKNNAIESKGTVLIRVRENPLSPLSENDVIVRKGELIKSDLNLIIIKLETLIPKNHKVDLQSYINSKDFLNKKIFRKYMSYLPSPFPGDSLLDLNSELSKEWHYKKNFPLRPENFMRGSGKKVWWKCSKGDDHEWETTISHRAKRGQGCPYCVGKKTSKDNNLLILCPDIAKEWHPTKNGDLRPENFMRGSHKKVWWKCSKGHEWEAIISNRARKSKGTGCTSCVR